MLQRQTTPFAIVSKQRVPAIAAVDDFSDDREERGLRILELSRSSLLLSMDGTRRDLSENNVTRIRQRLPDPLLNGAVIGAVSVMTLSTVSSIAFSDRGENETFGWADVGFILYLGSIGAGVGPASMR